MIAYLIALTLVLGCAGPNRVSRFAPAKIAEDALLDTLTIRDALLARVMGRISVTLETPTVNAAFKADYFFAAPDSFRANIRGLLGSTPGAVVSVGDSFAAYFPGSGTLFVAVGDPEEKNPVLGLNIQFKDLVEALFCLYNTGRNDSLVNFIDNGNIYELTFERGEEIIRMEVLPSKWVMGSKQVFDRGGTALLDIGYSDFVDRGGIVRPTKITIINPLRGESVTIEIEKEYIGRRLPEGIFEITVPEDIAVWRLI